MHQKTICKDFEIKKVRRVSWLVCSNCTLLLADVFANFKNIYLKIYELHPAKFLSAPGLAWQAALKRTKIRSFKWYRYVINGRKKN